MAQLALCGAGRSEHSMALPPFAPIGHNTGFEIHVSNVHASPSVQVAAAHGLGSQEQSVTLSYTHPPLVLSQVSTVHRSKSSQVTSLGFVQPITGSQVSVVQLLLSSQFRIGRASHLGTPPPVSTQLWLKHALLLEVQSIVGEASHAKVGGAPAIVLQVYDKHAVFMALQVENPAIQGSPEVGDRVGPAVVGSTVVGATEGADVGLAVVGSTVVGETEVGEKLVGD